MVTIEGAVSLKNNGPLSQYGLSFGTDKWQPLRQPHVKNGSKASK